jgi:hypothetical protein
VIAPDARARPGIGPDPAARRRAAMLWSGLCAGQVVFGAVFFVFARRVPVDGAPAPVAFLLGVLGLAAAALSFVVPRRAWSGAPPEATALARTVLAGALAESGTMIALVGWFVARGPALLAVAAVAFGAFLLHYPSAARFDRMVRP